MVAAAIDKLKPGKSCGNDGLAAEHFKYSDSRINVLLSLFYSSCIIHGYLPNDFMKTVIVPLVKNKTGDTSDVNNYRPIALVTIASKIFENIMLEILQPYLYTCDNQFGFKKGHSTDHCIFIAKNVIDYYRSNNSPVYSCFLDASKCFDKINHWSLFRKLILRGIPVLLVRILVFWYRNQSFCVKWGNITSSFFNVSNGVRQGGILSPYLFAIYVDDLSEQLNGLKVGLYMCNTPANHIYYADDLCVMAPSPAGLQTILDVCYRYAVDNDIVFNQLKSMCIVFKPDNFKLTCPPMYLDGATLDYVDNVKYLGVILNHKCCDDNDIRKHMRSLYARSNVLIRKFYNCTKEVKLKLFQSYCLPSYCSHLWVNYTKHIYSKLRVAFNKMYKLILGLNKFDSASHMYVTNGLDNFDAFMRKNIYGFMNRVCNMNNNLVRSTVFCTMYVRNSMWHKWILKLYTFTRL